MWVVIIVLWLVAGGMCYTAGGGRGRLTEDDADSSGGGTGRSPLNRALAVKGERCCFVKVVSRRREASKQLYISADICWTSGSWLPIAEF